MERLTKQYGLNDINQVQNLLIRGGTSSVGMAAAALAKDMGLPVIATTRDPAKAPALRDGGVDGVVIDTGDIAEEVHREVPGGVDGVLFLSYPHVDRVFVRRLAEAVAEAGFTVWYDRLGLSAGKSFPRVIQDALERTQYIGVVCTAVSCERPWVRKEIEAGLVREGREDREILIPLRLPGCALPLLMQSKDWADFSGPFEVGLENLLATLSGGRYT